MFPNSKFSQLCSSLQYTVMILRDFQYVCSCYVFTLNNLLLFQNKTLRIEFMEHCFYCNKCNLTTANDFMKSIT